LVYWQQSLKIDPRNAKSLWILANTYIEKHEAEQAVDLLKKACVIAPRSVRNYYLLGQAYRQLEQYENALGQYEKVIELDPNHYNAHYDLALTYRNLDQPDRAKEYLMRFQSLKKAAKTPIPEDIVSDDLPENLKKLARYYRQAYAIYKTNKRNTQGLPLLRRAIALDPRNTYYQELLGVFYTRNKQFSQAIAVYQHAQGIDPNQPLFGVNIGQLYTHLGQPAQAERMFIQTIENFPDYALGYVELVRLYLTAQKNLTKTIGLAQRAVDLQPSAGNYHLLSWTHTVNGQYPQALQAIEKAMALAPNNKKYQIHYEQIKNKK
jgi:tetratricopeptide (TPR) repeat protein